MDFNKIKSNLEILDGMDRLSYLIDLSKNNPGIKNKYKNEQHKINGCVSTAYLKVDQIEPSVLISTESDSEFVNGLLYVLKIYVENKTKNDIMEINESQLMTDLNIKNSISSQRLNGFYSAIKTLKKIISE